jgi:hypothetical protein
MKYFTMTFLAVLVGGGALHAQTNQLVTELKQNYGQIKDFIVRGALGNADVGVVGQSPVDRG